ncbi:6-phosphogluconolactonase [Leptinotarsa decemlineata]|uniref:6-phosphogluconolactonase n=1 Tax=Leptinotarsa decemlineata TaxID=7539 RepID=UPI003D308D42
MSIIVVENKDEVISKLCELIEEVAEKSIQTNGIFSVGVSGGSLAEFLSKGLPSIKSDFTKWRIFFCDERLVPVDDAESTFGLYKRTLIDSGAVNLKPEQFVQIKQGVSADEAATDYVEQISSYFKTSEVPIFDMLLLGMGPDGHTCSLFPGHKLLTEEHKWVASITDSPKPPPCRITLTYPVINNARFCIFAAAGAGKAAMIKRILVDKEDLPAARVKPTTGKLYWIVDKEAGLYVNKI